MAIVIVPVVAVVTMVGAAGLVSSLIDPTPDVHRLARGVEQRRTKQHVRRNLTMRYGVPSCCGIEQH